MWIYYTYMQCVVKSIVSVLFKRLCHFIQVFFFFMLFKKYSAAKKQKQKKKHKKEVLKSVFLF